MFVTNILNPLPKFDVQSCNNFKGLFSSLPEVTMPWKYPKPHLHDKIQVLEAWDKLHAILGDIKNLTKNNVSLLVLANMQDLEVSEKLELSSVQDQEYFLKCCSAMIGEGLHEGLEWLTLAIQGPYFLSFSQLSLTSMLESIYKMSS